MSGIEPVQEYNEYIKRHLLDAIHRGIVDGLPQPTMFGGKRMRNFVLPSSTEYDYPSSLSVGHLGASQSDMLGGSFWDDFGKGFKKGVSGVAQVAMPIVKEVGTDLAKDALRSYIKGSGRRKKKGGYLIGRNGEIRPQSEGAGLFDTFKSGFSSIGNAIAPIAKEVFHDVIVPEGKDYLKQQIKERRGKGGSKSSAIVAAMIGKQLKGFKLDKVSKPSGNVISYAKKAFGQTYKGRKPTDMWNTYTGEITTQPEAPKKRGRKPKTPAKKNAKGTSDIRGFFKSGSGLPLTGSGVMDDIGKIAKIATPFLPLLMGLGRGDPLPPHPTVKGGNLLDDLGKVSSAIAPFAPLLLGLGKGKPPSKYAINKLLKGGSFLDDLGKVSSAIAPFAPLLMGLGRDDEMCGGSFLDDLGKVSSAIAPFAPLLMAMGRKGGSLSGKAVRKTPMSVIDGHESAIFEPVHAVKKGGVLITDNASQFHINTGLMPPALASYNPPVPSVSGKGRKQLPQSGKKRESARGAIVAEVMKKHGLNLAQASKYVKEKGLY